MDCRCDRNARLQSHCSSIVPLKLGSQILAAAGLCVCLSHMVKVGKTSLRNKINNVCDSLGKSCHSIFLKGVVGFFKEVNGHAKKGDLVQVGYIHIYIFNKL